MFPLHICFLLTITLVHCQVFNTNPVRTRRGGDGFLFPDDQQLKNQNYNRVRFQRQNEVSFCFF